MKKLLLLSTFVSFCLSTNPTQEGLEVSIFRPFKRFGMGKVIGDDFVKKITIPISDFSDETTIAELKKKIALKARIPMKNLNGSTLLINNWEKAECEDNKTCQYYNLRESRRIDLILPTSNAATDFFRSVALLPGAAMFAICHKFVP